MPVLSIAEVLVLSIAEVLVLSIAEVLVLSIAEVLVLSLRSKQFEDEHNAEPSENELTNTDKI